MPNPDLKFIPGRLPDGYAAIPIIADQSATGGAALRLCVLARRAPDAAAGPLVHLRDLLDANVYLGCVCDAGGVVHEWVEVWVQDVSRLAESPPGASGSLTNTMVDDRWARQVKVFERTERPLLILTGWESKPAAPTWLDLPGGQAVHPRDAQSGDRWTLCRDDAVLAKAGLPAYSRSLHRYLYLPELGADGAFVAVTAGAPTTKACKPITELTGGGGVGGGGRADLVAFNPGGGMMLARAFSPVGLEAYVDLLSGAPWKGVPHGRSILDLELTTQSKTPGVADHLSEGGLFLGTQGKHGRLVESFHLRLRALADAVSAVRAMTQDGQRPLLNVSGDSFCVRLGEPARGLPYLWTSRVTLADPGDAVTLPVQAADAKYFVPGRSRGASIYRSESATKATQGRGTVRIREVLTERAEDLVLEGTLASDERVGATKNDLVWLRLNLKSGRLDVYARADAKAAMAAGEFRFRTLPQKIGADGVESLRAATGVPLAETPFEVIPSVSSPADMYSLGVLAVRTLLTDPRTPLPVALDETLSLARQLAGEFDAGVPLHDRIRRLFDKDGRWAASLGPQRLAYEDIKPAAAFDLVPADLWWRTLAAIVRMFPGIGPDSRCANLGDARPGGLHAVYDGVIEDLDALLRRTRSLIVIDWSYNREVHAVVRGFLTKLGGGSGAKTAAGR